MTDLTSELSQRIQGKYYGKFRGFVADNQDPERMGRLRLKIPSVLGDEVSGWALPCVPFGGLPGQGWFAVPEKNAQMWVEFEEGDLQHPIWTGTFWQKGEDVPKPTTDAQRMEPTFRLFRTPSGHLVELDDGGKQVVLRHAGGAEIVLSDEGAIHITDQAGGRVTLENDAITIEDTHGNRMTMDGGGTAVEDRSGNRIEMSSSGVTIGAPRIVLEGGQVTLGGAGGEPLLKGLSFLGVFNTHIHMTPDKKPTTPPVAQGAGLVALSPFVTTR